MAATWDELDTEFQALLGNAMPNNDSDTREAWLNQAIRTFAAQHTARLLTVSFSGDGAVQDFALPSDMIQVYSVYSDEEEMFLEPVSESPGVAWDTEATQANSVRPIGWQEWPTGTVHLTYAPEAAADNIVVKYFGEWTPFGDSDNSLPPTWSLDAIMTLGVANALVSSLSDISFLNEFRTRVDSGNPLHNPIAQAHDSLLKRYDWLLRDIPRQDRTPFYYPGGRR